jgi:hypothetical protein
VGYRRLGNRPRIAGVLIRRVTSRRHLSVTIRALAIILAISGQHVAAQPATPQAPAGTTPETAIVLPGIADEFHGVVAEHTYIAEHFPDWHIEYQTALSQNGRSYDLLGMIKPDRSRTAIYFDITDWVGK